MGTPKVSVVMSVFNGAETIEAAIQSIRAQTFADFEFIIVDDGSTDNTPWILERQALADNRLVLLRHENRGLTRSLTRGIRSARGTLIARQDADDVSMPERLALQVAHMDGNPMDVLLGTAWFESRADGLVASRPADREKLGRSLFLHNPFPHTSTMFRHDSYLAAGGYDERFDTSQDFELWMRLARVGTVAVLDERLVIRHVGPGSISSRRRFRQAFNGLRARLKHPDAGVLQALLASAYQAAAGAAPNWFVKWARQARGRMVQAPGSVRNDGTFTTHGSIVWANDAAPAVALSSRSKQ